MHVSYLKLIQLYLYLFCRYLSEHWGMVNTTRIQCLIIFFLMMLIRRLFHVYVPIPEDLQATPM